jgi:hypothetical protein
MASLELAGLDARLGLITGDFEIRKSPLQPLMRRKTGSLRPLFSRNHFLSGTDNRRVQVIRAQSGLGWTGKEDDNSEQISGELG